MEGDVITLQDIFVASHVDDVEEGKVTSKLRYTNVRPGFLEKLESYGVTLPKAFFANEAGANVDVLRRSSASARARRTA
jgi:pilus assembly protein CpaF